MWTEEEGERICQVFVGSLIIKKKGGGKLPGVCREVL